MFTQSQMLNLTNNCPANADTWLSGERWDSPDYILEQVAKRDGSGLYGAESAIHTVKNQKEPFVTGWTAEGTKEWLKKHDFTLIEDIDHNELTKRYLIGSDGKPDGRMMDWHRIVYAKVPQ